MVTVEQFVRGEMALEDALLWQGPVQNRLQLLLSVGDEDIMVGVREEGCLPLFTWLPVGMRAGFGVGADKVFRALDAMPPSEQSGKHRKFAPRSPELPSEVRPALVRALVELVKEGKSHADH